MDIQLTQIQLPNGKILGAGYPTYIIAEIGSNHDGDLDRAKMLIQKAKESGADAAKFQSFKVENLINQNSRVNQCWQPDPAWNVLEKLSLSFEWHSALKKEADRVGIDFISTPFDLERLQWLIDLNVPLIKIASGDLTYHELLKAAGKSGRPVLLSTGHATLGEVEAGLTVLWESGCKDIVLMHCTSAYPAKVEDANIKAMCSMQHGFQSQVGYSDHSPGNTLPIAAVALGACVLEKHFTDDNSRQGPDHPFALNVNEFADMVLQVRRLEVALAGGSKTPRPVEKIERVMARRALYTRGPITKGTVLSRDHIKIVRHNYPEGIPADQWKHAEGRVVESDIEENQLITWEMI
jgi:N,N'-diacetyllegionaminate synthase